MLLSVIQELPEYRCLVFQQSRNGETGPDEMDERFDELKKFIAKQNRQILGKHDEIGSDMQRVLGYQSELDDQLKLGFTTLAEKQLGAKDEILSAVRERPSNVNK